MIEVSHLSKSYGAFQAVRDVSFRVGEGEVVGFLGPNGAGKSTTLRILACFLGMTSGKVTIAGHDVVDDSEGARACIGYMPEAVPLYGEMRVSEYLTFRAELKGVPRKERRSHVERAMEEARVADFAEVLIAKLSKGYKQRVGLADALVARPPILILDEPTAGLDPNQIREVRALVRDLGTRHTVLVSTHILSEVESTCSRAIVIARGKVVGEGGLDELRAGRRSRGARLIVAAKGKTHAAVEAIVRGVTGVAKVTSEPLADTLSLDLTWAKKLGEGDLLVEEVVRALVENGVGVREASPTKASLDEVFAQLTEDRPPGDEDEIRAEGSTP